MSTLSALQTELAEYEDGLQTCVEYLAIEPEDEDTKSTQVMLKEQIADVKSRIAAEISAQDAVAPPPPPPTDDADAPPPPPKYDMSKHPKYRDSAPPPPPDEAQPQHTQIFNVKDVVLAKYTEDKQWYPASIISKTGSSTDPVYTVTFKGYGNTETKRKHEIRSLHNPNTDSKKRKADGSPAVSTPATPASPKPAASGFGGGHVISAAPAVDTSLVQQQPQKYIPSKVSDGPTRMAPEPKKLKGHKKYDKGQASWQNFTKTGPKKTGAMTPTGTSGAFMKKESQFRTNTNPNAKVGFTGSGKPMSKDQERKTWKYASGGQLDDD